MTSFSVPTPSVKLKLGSIQKASPSEPSLTLSLQDKAAISKATDDLKQVQEATKYAQHQSPIPIDTAYSLL